MSTNTQSHAEQRIRKLTQLYYSNKEVQKIMVEFGRNREISPRYFEGFGKRPDILQYNNDVFELVKRGATSFHCSEETWKNPLQIKTGMTPKELNKIRTGWDLLIDIDCKWFDYSKLAARAVIKVLENHGINNIGIKFSGSKGWHILVPYKAFPKKINNISTNELFPELPRKVIEYIKDKARLELLKLLPKDFHKQFQNTKIKQGIKCNNCNEIAKEFVLLKLFCDSCKIGEEKKQLDKEQTKFKCSSCSNDFHIQDKQTIYECEKCRINSKKNPEKFSKTIETDLFELMGLDLILVSPRHLFRMPYSLHEKTSLVSMTISKEQIEKFELTDARIENMKIKEFMPNSKENEARELVREALDWTKEKESLNQKQNIQGKFADYKPIKLNDVSEKNYPNCILKILQGLDDGKKRGLFVLINFFRSIGLEKTELEEKINKWNQKNSQQLPQPYINAQLQWSYKNKPILPQNCKEFYQSLGVCLPDMICNKIKNPVNYTIRKNFAQAKTKKKVKKKMGKKTMLTTKFKNNN